MSNLNERRKIVSALRTGVFGRIQLYTTHLKPLSRNFLVRCNDLTSQSANDVHACGGYLNLTVRQLYFARHRRRMQFPFLPCIIEFGNNGHRSFFPMEFLELHFGSEEEEKNCDGGGGRTKIGNSRNSNIPRRRSNYIY